MVIVDEARGIGLSLYIPAHLRHASKHARRCVSQRTACVFAVAFCTIHSIRLLHTGVTPSTPYTILIRFRFGEGEREVGT